MGNYWHLEKMIIFPLRRLCRSLSSRLRFRKTGILILSQEVEACEYEDVHIMWDMLRRTEISIHHQQHPVESSSKLLKINSPDFRINIFSLARSCYMPQLASQNHLHFNTIRIEISRLIDRCSLASVLYPMDMNLQIYLCQCIIITWAIGVEVQPGLYRVQFFSLYCISSIL